MKAIYTKNRRIFDIIGICYLYFEDVIYREDDGHSKGAAPKAAASGANYRIEFFFVREGERERERQTER